MLHTDSRTLERILIMGSWGTGKSEAWCSVAKWLQKTKSDNKVFVLDTDNAYDRLIEGQDYEKSVQGYDCFEWASYKEAIADVYKNLNPNKQDWLVLDMADKPWETVQNHYVETTQGTDADEFFLQWRVAGNKQSPLSGEYGINWQVINKLYASFISKVTRFPGHVITCTPVDVLSKEEKKDVVDTFGKYGVKPRGQKALGHQCHTLLLAQQKGKTGWTYTSVKDRKRQLLVNEDVTDFVSSYLIKIAGWQI